MANSDLNASSSAQTETQEFPQESDSTKLANKEAEEAKPIQTESPSQTEEKPIESKEPENIPQPQDTTTVSFSEETKPDNLVNQPQNQSQTTEVQEEKQPENTTLQQDDIDVKPPDNQASQVQSGPSDNVSRVYVG